MMSLKKKKSLIVDGLQWMVLMIFFDDNIENSSGHLYGLGAPFSVNVNNFQDNGENGNSS
ncbi:unnamed protein product [Spodoptera exigua]|nr:unnamed protein product [Spodoptera exigua]